MPTRIFAVNYDVTELYDGKDRHTFSETRSVVARNALEAIAVVQNQNLKATSYIDDESKKKVKVTRSAFTPMNVNLIASTD